MKHVTLCVALFLFMLITACASAPSGATGPAAQGTSPQGQPPAVVNAPQELPGMSGSGSETTAAGAEYTPGALWVKILSPQDGSVVKTSTIKVTGQAPAETVLTVNDEIVLVSQDQTFEQAVTLQKGSNLIEVLASDTSGNEVYVPLTVTYKP